MRPGSAGWWAERLRVITVIACLVGLVVHQSRSRGYFIEGSSVEQLAFVVTGRLDAVWGEQLLNSAPAGGVVGEFRYLTGNAASAGVVAGLPSRLSFLAHGDTEKTQSVSPGLHSKIMYVLSRQLVDKLASSNRQGLTASAVGMSA